MKIPSQFAALLASTFIFSLSAHAGNVTDVNWLTAPINHTTEAEHIANGCKYLTYYKLTHDRYVAAPLAHASQYSNVIGAVRMLDYRCAGGINVNHAPQYEPTSESNVTTEALSPKDMIPPQALHSIELDPRSSTSDGKDKRFVFGWAAATALWSGISFASKLFSTACIATSTFWSGTKTSTAVCVFATISGALDLASGLINALRVGGGTVGTVTSNSYSSYSVYTQGAGYEAWNNVKRDPNDPLHEWLWAHSGLRHLTHGHNYTHRDVLMANETHPIVWHHPVSGAEGATWVVPHPLNETRNIVTVKPTHRQVFRKDATLSKRDGCITEDNDEYTICGSGDTMEPSMIVGLDMYGGSTADWDIETSLGGEGSVNNGEGNLMSLAATYTNNYQSWDNCLCYLDNGEWVGTGSVQYTWDGVYNGYSSCWAADCAGATDAGF